VAAQPAAPVGKGDGANMTRDNLAQVDVDQPCRRDARRTDTGLRGDKIAPT
jgi:hypothetical protein